MPDTVKVSIPGVRKTLAGAMDMLAALAGISRQRMLLDLLELKFGEIEQQLIQAAHDFPYGQDDVTGEELDILSHRIYAQRATLLTMMGKEEIDGRTPEHSE